MKRSVLATVGITVASLFLAGCSERAATETPQSAPRTLHQYVVENKIAETPFRRGDPDTPTVDFASPPGWSNAGDRTPDWAYGAIVYDKAENPQDPPFMIAIASKLAGKADRAKVLEYAPGQLNSLPDFTPSGPPTRTSLSGFEAVDYLGTFAATGERKAIGQITIAVPGKDAVFVLQLNAVAPPGQEQVVADAVKVIIEKTTISAPI